MSRRAKRASKSDPERTFVCAYATFTLALFATLGSVFFGEVMKLPPCTLCWYQRICLFPLPLLLAVGIAQRDARLAAYCMPLALIGLGVSSYHNLLQLGVIPETLSPCTGGVPCSERQIAWLGFLTIPLMALSAFSMILVGLIGHVREQRRGERWR